jgi:hypothetical protein
MRLPIRLRLGASPRRVRDVLLELIRLSMLVAGEPILSCVEGVEIEGLPALSEVEGFVVIWLLMRDVLSEFLLLSGLAVPLILLRIESRFAIDELNPL